MSITPSGAAAQAGAGILSEIHAVLQGLRFGPVEITVHNSQVVQIERKAKFRPPPQPKQP